LASAYTSQANITSSGDEENKHTYEEEAKQRIIPLIVSSCRELNLNKRKSSKGAGGGSSGDSNNNSAVSKLPATAANNTNSSAANPSSGRSKHTEAVRKLNHSQFS